MSAVGVAWRAIRIAPPAPRGLVVGGAGAAYTLPGAAGAVLLARPLRALAGRHLVAADAALRAVTLSVIPLLYTFGALRAGPYVALLAASRSEEHTSELQSPDHLVCRLLLEKKKMLD